MSNEIIRDYRICKNPMGATLHDAKRYSNAPAPREEQIFKHSKVKKAGLPQEVKANKVFDFNYYKNGNKLTPAKEVKPIKKDKKFDVKQDSKGNKTSGKNLN
jgi:hypothetical protein